MAKTRKYSIEDLDGLITSIKAAENMNEDDITDRLEYNRGYISQIRSRGDVPEKFIKALKREFVKSKPYDEGKKNGATMVANEPEMPFGKDAVYSLSESNRIIAESNKALAESNRLLAKSNLELVEQVKGSVSGAEEKRLTVQTILPGLQELLIDLGLGTLWENRSVGLTTVNKRLFGQQEKKPLKGIRDGSGK